MAEAESVATRRLALLSVMIIVGASGATPSARRIFSAALPSPSLGGCVPPRSPREVSSPLWPRVASALACSSGSSHGCAVAGALGHQPCQNGGRCLDGVRGFKCICTSDYSGDTCETQNIIDPILYLTITAVLGGGSLVAAFVGMKIYVERQKTKCAELDDTITFERWMVDEHHRRGESAADRAKR